VCEVEFRVAPGKTAGVEELNSTYDVLGQRLGSGLESDFKLAKRDGGSFVITLTRSLDDAGLAQLRRWVEHRGHLEFLIVANSNTPDYDETEEQRRLDAWRATHRDADIAQFNQLARESGGPVPSIEWHTHRPGSAPSPSEATLACERAIDAASTFTTADLGRVFPSSDDSGEPAIGFEMLERRRADFGKLTTRCLKRRMAIVYDGEILMAPVVNAPLVGSAIIEAHFTEAERDEMVAILSRGELPLALEFVELRKLR
jgi:preprotein translocase subunit SecD